MDGRTADSECCADALFVRDKYNYDATTGELTFRNRRSGRLDNHQVGHLDRKGYRKLRAFGICTGVHRIVWLHFYGKWPAHHIDHINGNKTDNRIANLRDVPLIVNAQNRPRPLSNNKLGVAGVRLRRGRYRAEIEINGRTVSLGTFDTVQQAQAAYLSAKSHHHPGFVVSRMEAAKGALQ